MKKKYIKLEPVQQKIQVSYDDFIKYYKKVVNETEEKKLVKDILNNITKETQ